MSGFLAPSWLVYGSAVGLLLTALWTAAGSRGSKRRRLILLVVHLLAIVSLWLLVAQPARVLQGGGRAQLLTSGGDPPENGADARRLALPGAAAAGAEQFTDLAAVARTYSEIDRLDVYGHGLRLPEWRETPRWKLNVRAPPLPPGLVDMRWPQQAIVGRRVELSGRVHIADGDEWTAIIEAPGGATVDSAIVDQDGRFELALRGPVSGPLNYTLRVVDRAGEERFRETVPVWVTEARAPRALMLLSGPSFEARELKNWLADSATDQRRPLAGLTLEVELAPAIRRRETAGAAPPAASLDEASLKRLDLLVLDGARLADLSQDTYRRVERAVEQGLGVLLLGDDRAPEAVRGKALFNSFELRAGEDGGQIRIGDDPLPVQSQALRMGAGPAEILLRDGFGRAVLAVRNREIGRVGVSLLVNSYVWRRAASGALYEDIWGRLLERVVRRREAPVAVTRQEGPLGIGEALQVCLLGEQRPSCRREWFDREGWQVFGEGADAIGVYVHADRDWAAWRAQLRQRDTRLAGSLAILPATDRFHRVPAFNPWMLWSVFLLAAGGLWLEQKFAADNH